MLLCKVSVLMPIYKTDEKYLREAIDSILSQTFSNFEFLILDDCPEDDRESIVNSYNDNRIIYKKNEKHLGISRSRNKLLEMAKGEYIAIFDHDDISLPSRFERQVQYLDHNPFVGVVGTWADTYPIAGVLKLHHFIDNYDIKRELIHGCPILHPSAMIRKKVLVDNHIKYEERYSPAEDYMLWCRLIEFTQFHNIPEVLLKYRYHDSNTSLNKEEQMKCSTQEIRLFVKNKYPSLYYDFLINNIKEIKFTFLFFHFSVRFINNYMYVYWGKRFRLLKLKVLKKNPYA